ncbi:MAG: mechanosensitive ion channel [Burkholderiaceae bacterium]
MPGLGLGLESKKPATTATVASDPESQTLRLQKRATSLAAEIAQLEAPGGLGVGAPPGISEAQLTERLSVVQFTANAVNQNLEILRRIDSLSQARDEMQARIESWGGLEEKPPYSIQFVDGLRAEQLGAAKRVLALEKQRKTAQDIGDRTLDQLKTAEVALRQAQERLEQGESGPAATVLAWQRQLAQLRARAARASAARTDAEIKLIELNVDEAKLEAELASRRFETTAGAVRFDEAELARIRGQLDERGVAIEREEKRLLASAAGKGRALEKARAELERARATTVTGETAMAAAARVRAAERQVDLLRTAVNTAGQRVDLVSQERDLLQLSRTIWDTRYSLAHDRSAAALLKARSQLKQILSGIGVAREYYAQQREEVKRRLDDVDQRLKSVDLSADDQAYLQSLRGAYTDLLDDLDRSAATVEAAAALNARYAEEIESARPTISVVDRVKDFGAWTRSATRSFFNAELLAIDDTIEVDGQKISGTRSVTVGKVLSAIVILVLGYYLVKVALALATRVAVLRFKADPNYAKLFSRWMLSLSIVVLVVIALVVVKIPLTVFAFLGGAIAIGFGFGTQNLIKNLISGLMVLGERPFRLGDYIIVGDKAGTVTSIDLRSTTIIDVDGIETLIPNSTFIEQNVTNWTYTSKQVRYSIKIGVAYGSPVRQVMDLLQQAAERHGHVLKAPAPEVLFVNFGADSLDFALHYWLDLGASTGRVVASDLRAMIATSFTAAGIEIPFAQRDVHLDASAPIPVQVVSGGSHAAPTRAAPA